MFDGIGADRDRSLFERGYFYGPGFVGVRLLACIRQGGIVNFGARIKLCARRGADLIVGV